MLEQIHLVLELRGERVVHVVLPLELRALHLRLNEVKMRLAWCEDEMCAVIEMHSDAAVRERIGHALLVAVVDPADDKHTFMLDWSSASAPRYAPRLRVESG